jgi:hypothetical protein
MIYACVDCFRLVGARGCLAVGILGGQSLCLTVSLTGLIDCTRRGRVSHVCSEGIGRRPQHYYCWRWYVWSALAAPGHAGGCVSHFFMRIAGQYVNAFSQR